MHPLRIKTRHWLIFLAFLCSCANQQNATNGHNGIDYAAAAEARFRLTPRSPENVTQALDLIAKATRTKDVFADEEHYYTLCKASLYALWLSFNGASKNVQARHASTALRYAEQALQLRQDDVRGYYYRAIARGLLAEANKATARRAMYAIRDDAERAIAIDPTFDDAGPQRLLGALYLRTPGPPAGIGSLRKAQEHFEQALALAPDNPENLNFMAELDIRLGKYAEAKPLLQRILNTNWPDGDLVDAATNRSRALNLQQKLEKAETSK